VARPAPTGQGPTLHHGDHRLGQAANQGEHSAQPGRRPLILFRSLIGGSEQLVEIGPGAKILAGSRMATARTEESSSAG